MPVEASEVASELGAAVAAGALAEAAGAAEPDFLHAFAVSRAASARSERVLLMDFITAARRWRIPYEKDRLPPLLR
jgi:hypothetical protein